MLYQSHTSQPNMPGFDKSSAYKLASKAQLEMPSRSDIPVYSDNLYLKVFPST